MSNNKKLNLEKSISNTVFFRKFKKGTLLQESDIKLMPEMKAWEVIKKLKSKDFKIEEVINYTEKFGLNLQLRDSVNQQLELLKERNRNSILWRKEFEYLNVSSEKQKSLEIEYDMKVRNEIEKNTAPNIA